MESRSTSPAVLREAQPPQSPPDWVTARSEPTLAGSVREPAALCGVVGLKPTYGRVSARGVIPLSISLDHVGPIGRTVADVAVIFAAIAGYDPADKASVNVPVEDYVAACEKELQPLRVGVPKKFFFEDLDAEVASAINHAIAGLAAMGAEIREMELQVPTDRTLQSAESYAFHAEFVGAQPGALPAGNPAPDSYRTECQP